MYSLSATLATASSQILCTAPIKTTAFRSGSSNTVYRVMMAFLYSTMAQVGPDSIFRRVLLPPQLSCCCVPMWPAGLELLISDVVAPRLPGGDEQRVPLDDGHAKELYGVP